MPSRGDLDATIQLAGGVIIDLPRLRAVGIKSKGRAMQPGQQITPNLRLVRLLGQGGMGSVWLAEHLTLKTHVAVKFMAPLYLDSPDLVQRFQTEAVAAARLKSPHVAQIFDHGIKADGTPYIVMEFLEGEDLNSLLTRRNSLSLKEIFSIVEQVAKALGRAHNLGIVHRDIKPENIFLVSLDGELLVKVLDFGIAKLTLPDAAGSATTTKVILGTPFYMSPEQLFSTKLVDHRTDLWALAVVVYRAITATFPFKGDTIAALGVVVHAGVFTPPSALMQDVPSAVDRWFEKAFQPDRNRRFNSAKEMVEALGQAIREEPEPVGTLIGGVSPPVVNTNPQRPLQAGAPNQARLHTDQQNVQLQVPTERLARMAGPLGNKAAPVSDEMLRSSSLVGTASIPMHSPRRFAVSIALVAIAMFAGIGGIFAVASSRSPRVPESLTQPAQSDATVPTLPPSVTPITPLDAALATGSATGTASALTPSAVPSVSSSPIVPSAIADSRRKEPPPKQPKTPVVKGTGPTSPKGYGTSSADPNTIGF
jgi:serine/threonine protein kinase